MPLSHCKLISDQCTNSISSTKVAGTNECATCHACACATTHYTAEHCHHAVLLKDNHLTAKATTVVQENQHHTVLSTQSVTHMFAWVLYRCSHMYVGSKHAGTLCSNVMQHSCCSTTGEPCWLGGLHSRLRLPSPCKGVLCYSPVLLLCNSSGVCKILVLAG